MGLLWITQSYVYVGDKSRGMVKKKRLTKGMKWKKGYRNFQLSVILHFKEFRNRLKKFMYLIKIDIFK